MAKRKENWIKITMRIVGNFGTSFFSPLVSINLASSYFATSIDFWQSIVIALISSIFVTGLSVSREMEKYGREN